MEEGATCRDVKARAETKIEEVEARIRDLRRIRDALSQLADSCDREDKPTSECPILDALDADRPLGPSLE